MVRLAQNITSHDCLGGNFGKARRERQRPRYRCSRCGRGTGHRCRQDNYSYTQGDQFQPNPQLPVKMDVRMEMVHRKKNRDKSYRFQDVRWEWVKEINKTVFGECHRIRSRNARPEIREGHNSLVASIAPCQIAQERQLRDVVPTCDNRVIRKQKKKSKHLQYDREVICCKQGSTLDLLWRSSLRHSGQTQAQPHIPHCHNRGKLPEALPESIAA